MQMPPLPKRPVEWFESPDLPEKPRFDPVARIFHIVGLFVILQACTLLAVIWLCFR